jgi:glycosyltransferase involved in cell wall biosynthesis
MKTISAVVITNNEERNIEDCLSSLKFADEMIVVDSGSNDRTLELARKFTGKIFSQPLTNFYVAKNFGIENASGDWILSVDADERVPPELADEIKLAVESSSQEAGYFIPRRNFLGKRWLKNGGQYPDFQLRLFRKGKSKFSSVSVHERVEVEGRVGYLQNALLHYTYRDISDFIQKIDRYTTLEVKQAGGSAKISLFDLAYLPARKFVSTYFLKSGYKDGALGITVCGLTAFYTFLKLAKMWERREQKLEIRN